MLANLPAMLNYPIKAYFEHFSEFSSREEYLLRQM